jgi:hypothetical protein
MKSFPARLANFSSKLFNGFAGLRGYSFKNGQKAGIACKRPARHDDKKQAA